MSGLIWVKTVCKQIGRTDSVSESFFFKRLILKNVSRWQQKHEKLPSIQRVNQLSQSSALYITNGCDSAIKYSSWWKLELHEFFTNFSIYQLAKTLLIAKWQRWWRFTTTNGVKHKRLMVLYSCDYRYSYACTDLATFSALKKSWLCENDWGDMNH